jgi:hypothetical protein
MSEEATETVRGSLTAGETWSFLCGSGKGVDVYETQFLLWKGVDKVLRSPSPSPHPWLPSLSAGRIKLNGKDFEKRTHCV